MNLIYSLILKFRTMKNLSVFLSLFMLISVSLSAQIPPDQDWAQFGRYEEANAGVAVRPLAVLIGDSITDGWDGKDPGFFSENNLVCRGISGQVSSQMLIRFRKDVLDLNPKYAVILDHQPNDYKNQAEAKVDLVLSGHTHGGQLFPLNKVGEWIGANDRTYGYERRGSTDFIVTSGLSDWAIKFKTGTKSEFVVIDIKKK